MSRFDRFDFDKTVDRRRSNSMKWDVAENELPMWVADMDFQTAPAVRQAIQKRAEHGVFGYTIVPDAWYEAYMLLHGRGSGDLQHGPQADDSCGKGADSDPGI